MIYLQVPQQQKMFRTPEYLLIAVEKSSKVARQEVAVVCMGGEDSFFGHMLLL
jgi:hypothetical protein